MPFSQKGEIKMVFRADESAQDGYAGAERLLIPKGKWPDEIQRAKSQATLLEIVGELGPVISQYPSWHPLVCNQNDGLAFPATTPGDQCGYKGLDHTFLFVNGFITCPYSDGQDVIDSVAAFPRHPCAALKAQRLDAKFYHPSATPILVTCEWEFRDADMTFFVPLSTALPLLLEKELPSWRTAEGAETWETMRTYFLGQPCGSKSSLFVTQETGQAMKKVWETIIKTGIFGPVHY